MAQYTLTYFTKKTKQIKIKTTDQLTDAFNYANKCEAKKQYFFLKDNVNNKNVVMMRMKKIEKMYDFQLIDHSIFIDFI